MFNTKTKIDTLDMKCLGTNIVGDKKITYLKNDTHVGKSIKEGRHWERWMFPYIQNNYIENTNMLDLGGNIGTSTLMMSEILSPKYKIFTFEPIYSDILLKNVIDNNLSDNIDVFPYGVGNKITTLKIRPVNFNDNKNFGAVSIIRTLTKNDDSLNINIVPVDYFNFENVSLIKIDVEHMEIEVLEGCLNLIKRCKPTILIETYYLSKLKETNIFKVLLDMGYNISPIPEGCNDYIMKI